MFIVVRLLTVYLYGDISAVDKKQVNYDMKIFLDLKSNSSLYFLM